MTHKHNAGLSKFSSLISTLQLVTMLNESKLVSEKYEMTVCYPSPGLTIRDTAVSSCVSLHSVDTDNLLLRKTKA